MNIRRFLLACGAASSVLYLIAIDVIAALRFPAYHDRTSQMVSELFAEGAPTRALMIWLNVPYNLLVLAFVVGVWKSTRGKRFLHLAAAALAGYGVVSLAGLLFFQMDLRGTVDSTRDAPHVIATFIMSSFLVAAMAFGAFALGARFRLYSFASIATVMVFGVLAGFLARPMPGPTPYVGLAERVNIYATMVWIAAFAVGVLRNEREENIKPTGPSPFR